MVRKRTIRSPRLARKRRQKAGRRAFWIAIAAALVLGATVYGFSRPQFRITDIEIRGAARVQSERVSDVVREELAGSYLPFIARSHTLLYPKAAIKKRLLLEFPAFSGISISLRNLASLRVAVEERRPVALWCTGAAHCFLIDETGFVFEEAEQGMEDLYYRFEQATSTPPMGTRVIESERLSLLFDFLKRLDDLSLDPLSVALGEQGELLVTLLHDVRVLVRETALEESLQNLQTLMAQNVLPGENGSLEVAYIDLRYGNKIYFKPR